MTFASLLISKINFLNFGAFPSMDVHSSGWSSGIRPHPIVATRLLRAQPRQQNQSQGSPRRECRLLVRR